MPDRIMPDRIVLAAACLACWPCWGQAASGPSQAAPSQAALDDAVRLGTVATLAPLCGMRDEAWSFDLRRAAVMDATGDLVVRTSRGSLTIWERATGDNLVWNLEFLRAAMGAAFDGQGRLEVVGERASRIDIARETRPVSEILAEIACRVPLRVVGSRLEAAPVDCRPASGVR